MRTSISKAIFWFCLAACPSLAQAQMFFEADAVFLGRNQNGGTTIAPGISTNTGSYGAESGYRISIGSILDTWQVDATFTQISPWTGEVDRLDSSSINLATGLEFEGFLNTAADASLPTPVYSLNLDNFEAASRSNYRDVEIMIGSSYANHRWRVAGGYRHAQLDEQNGLLMEGAFAEAPIGAGLDPIALLDAGATYVTGVPAAITNNTPVQYALQSQTTNHVNGFQTTFGVQFVDGRWLTLEGIAKAGIYHNQMSGRVTEILRAETGAPASVYQQIHSGKKSGAAFIGNLGLRAVIGVTDYIDIVGGGEVLFLSGVALGNDQYNGVSQTMVGTSAYEVQNRGSMVAYGGNIGLRIYW